MVSDATRSRSSLTNASSSTPTIDARHCGRTPSFSSRDGGCRIFCAHFCAAGPSASVTGPSGAVRVSVPSVAATPFICANGMVSRTSPPRNSTASVSSRAVPLTVLPLIFAVHFASAPIVLEIHCRVAVNRRRRFTTGKRSIA